MFFFFEHNTFLFKIFLHIYSIFLTNEKQPRSGEEQLSSFFQISYQIHQIIINYLSDKEEASKQRVLVFVPAREFSLMRSSFVLNYYNMT